MTLREQIRQALADYMWSEGCSCCQNTDAHNEAKAKFAKLLKVPKWKDGSGYDFGKFQTKQ
jgi:hypothetical protein